MSKVNSRKRNVKYYPVIAFCADWVVQLGRWKGREFERLAADKAAYLGLTLPEIHQCLGAVLIHSLISGQRVFDDDPEATDEAILEVHRARVADGIASFLH